MDNHQFKPIPVSDMGALCRDFVSLHRSLGKKYQAEAKVLRQFTCHCEESYPNSTLPEDAIYNWVNSFPNQSLKTKYSKNGTLKLWAQYLFSLGYRPMKIPLVRHTNNTEFVPHIFTSTEMQAIWNTVDHMRPVKAHPNAHQCIPVLFRLLYSSGLRISEALQITLEDIDFVSSVITLHHTKLGKERLIPMSDSLANVVKVYVTSHASEIGNGDPIFYYRKGKLLSSRTVYGRFRLVLQDGRIPYEGRLRGPRVHDFRHTFAVNVMNKFADEGKDLYVILPILSAYLGHADVSATERYVRLTEERLSTITDHVQEFIPNFFPEVENNEEI